MRLSETWLSTTSCPLDSCCCCRHSPIPYACNSCWLWRFFSSRSL
jgi:hypothetical protein